MSDNSSLIKLPLQNSDSEKKIASEKCNSPLSSLEGSDIERQPEDFELPKINFSSLVPRPDVLPHLGQLVVEPDLQTIAGEPRMRRCEAIFPRRHLITRSMPYVAGDTTDFERDCEKIDMVPESKQLDGGEKERETVSCKKSENAKVREWNTWKHF